MAPMPAELATLRALTFRISSTPNTQLPQHVPAIAASLANCKALLSSAQTSGSKSSSEASVALHRYRTLLSTLLQDRTAQGRWAAIVLIKASIELGGWETLQKSLSWVRGLLGILSKPDPPSAKKLCIITLTRVFMLTREYPTLVREITTPSLPAFVQASLQIATSEAPATLLQTILESFNQLLPRHPTIFRTYVKQLHQILGQTVAPTPSSQLGVEQVPGTKFVTASEVSQAARKLHTQLACSAPKGAVNEEWQGTFKATIENTHRVTDKIFRAVVEDWKPATRDRPPVNGHTLDDDVQDLEVDSMALPPWSGIFAGGERLVGLLKLTASYLESTTASPVSLNISLVLDLLTRLLSLTVPSGNKGFQNTVRFNNQVSKEERENLWLLLPSIHATAIELLLALLSRCDLSISAVNSIMLDQLVWVFTFEKETPRIRTACYLALAQLLVRSGVALPKASVDPLGIIIRACCDDILSIEDSNTSSKQSTTEIKTNGTSQQASANADAFLSISKSSKDTNVNFSGLQEAAYNLLPILFTHISPRNISDSLRARLDRTAILASHKDAMVASVLNPPPSRRFGKPTASILPLLARTSTGEQDVEAMIRPRMPAIRIGVQDSDIEDEHEGEEDAMEDIEEDIEEKEEHFVGNELDSLLETAATTEDGGADVTKTEVAGASIAPLQMASLDNLDLNLTGDEQQIAIQDFARSQDGGKRVHEEDAPRSPEKRVKFSEDDVQNLAPSASDQPPAASPTIITTSASAVPSEGTSSFTAGPTTSQVPVSLEAAALAAEKEDDSDDEDIVPLVLGQDTDEEESD